jgi:hypothetical protein
MNGAGFLVLFLAVIALAVVCYVRFLEVLENTRREGERYAEWIKAHGGTGSSLDDDSQPIRASDNRGPKAA